MNENYGTHQFWLEIFNQVDFALVDAQDNPIDDYKVVHSGLPSNWFDFILFPPDQNTYNQVRELMIRELIPLAEDYAIKLRESIDPPRNSKWRYAPLFNRVRGLVEENFSADKR